MASGKELYPIIILSVITVVSVVILLIVLNVNKKKQSSKLEEQMKVMNINAQGQERNAVNNEESAISDYKNNTYTYIFVKLKKKGLKSISMNKFIGDFFNALQSFPEDTKLRKCFGEIKNPNDVGFDIVDFDILYNLGSRKSIIGRKDQILLEKNFDLDLEKLVDLNKSLDEDAKALCEKILALY